MEGKNESSNSIENKEKELNFNAENLNNNQNLINQYYASSNSSNHKIYFKNDLSDKNSNEKSTDIATMIEELKKEQNLTKNEIKNEIRDVGDTLGKKIDELANQFKEIKDELKAITNALTKNKNYFFLYNLLILLLIFNIKL